MAAEENQTAHIVRYRKQLDAEAARARTAKMVIAPELLSHHSARPFVSESEHLRKGISPVDHSAVQTALQHNTKELGAAQ